MTRLPAYLEATQPHAAMYLELKEDIQKLRDDFRRELADKMATFEENEAKLKADIELLKSQESAEDAADMLTKQELEDAKSKLATMTAERDQLQKDKEAGALVDADREAKLQADILELETLIQAQPKTPVETTPTAPVETTAPVNTTTPPDLSEAPSVPEGSTSVPDAGNTTPPPPADVTTPTSVEPEGDSISGGNAPMQTDGGVTTIIEGNAGDNLNVPR